MTYALGIDLGGTKIAAGVVDDSGSVLARSEVATPATSGPQAVLAAVVRVAREALAAAGDPVVLAAGIGAAGVIDVVNRVVVSATDTLPGWAGTRIGEELEAALGVPVLVENDVHAHALGEARLGAGLGLSSVLMVAAGTGVGGALVVGGVLQRGAGHVAGHFGHVPAAEAAGLPCTCGGQGHVEMVSAGPAIHAAYARHGGTAAAPDTRAVFDLAAEGDSAAITAVDEGARALGRVIGGLINAIDPAAVVVSGGLAARGEEWWGPLRAGVAAETIPAAAGCPVLPAALGSNAAIIGAALAALDTVPGRTV